MKKFLLLFILLSSNSYSAVIANMEISINGSLPPAGIIDIYNDDAVAIDGSGSYEEHLSHWIASYDVYIDGSFFQSQSDPISAVLVSGLSLFNQAGAGNHTLSITAINNWGQQSTNFTGRTVLLYGADRPSEVPLPAAAWLFLSALGGLGIIKRKRS